MVRIVIGEGELDEAPMLYIGEKLGTKVWSRNLDIAVDPVEGTNFAAKNLPGGISVIAIAEKNNLISCTRDIYGKNSCSVKTIEKE